MAIKVTCDNCKTVFNVNENLAGKKGKCPKCQNPLEVPAKSKPLDFNFGEEKVENVESNETKETILDNTNEEPKNNESEAIPESEEPDVKVEKKKSKGKRFLFFTILFFFIGVGSYGYYLYQENPEDNIIVNNELFKTYISDNTKVTDGGKDNIDSGLKEDDTIVVREDINYSFNLRTNFESIKNEEIVSKGFLNLDDAKLISNAGGLKQQISLGQISSQYSYLDNKSQFIIENVDFVSDNEKLYFYIGKGYEFILNENSIYSILKSGKTTKETISKITDTFKDEEYVMVDNGKAILKLLGDLSSNKLVKDIAIGFTTSNPLSYFSQNGIDKEIKSYLTRDRFMFYLLKESKENKDILEINSNICKDLQPLLISFSKDLLNSYGIDDDSILKGCSKNIGYVNKLLSSFDKISKEGDTKKGNFKLVFIKDEKEVISIDYKKHIVDTWKLDIENDSITFNISGNINSILSSIIKINVELSWIVISGEITDGNGVIDMKGEDVKGKLNINDYFIDDYSLNINKQGLELNSNYKQGEFNIDVYSLGSKGKFSYDNGKINGYVKAGGILNYTFNGNYDDLENFHLLSIDDNLGTEILLNAEEKEEGFTEYKILVKVKGKEITSGTAKLTRLSEEELNKYNLEGSVKYSDINKQTIVIGNELIEEPSIEIKVEDTLEYNSAEDLESTGPGFMAIEEDRVAVEEPIEKPIIEEKEMPVEESIIKEESTIFENEIKFNINFSYKKGGEEYKIPENFKELEINASEMLFLPDFGGYKGFNKKNLLLFGAIGAGASLATTSFQGYGENTDNSKSLSDAKNILTLIAIKETEGISLSKMVVLNEEYKGENITIGGKKLVFGQNYFVGTPNYEVLQISKSDFLTSDGDEYIIGMTTISGGGYQILLKINSGGGIEEYNILGNYNPSDFKILRKGKDYEIVEVGEGEEAKAISLLADSNIDLIRKGDNIGGKEVLKVSSDGKIITFDKVIKSNSILLKPDSKGLIFINGKMILDGDIVE